MRSSGRDIRPKKSLSTNIFKGFIILIFSISFTFVSLFIYLQHKFMENSLINEGLAIAKDLSFNSRLGIFSENRVFLQGTVTGMLERKEVVYVAIYNLEGKLLEERSKTEAIGQEIPINVRKEIEEKKAPISINIGTHFEFWAPVMSSSVERESEGLILEDELLPPGSYRSEIIGFVRLGITKEFINKNIAQITLWSIFINIVFLVIGITLVYFIARKITGPLIRLTEGVKAIEEGDLTHKVPIEGEDEIGHFAMAFNIMSDSLVQREQSLKRSEEQIRASLQEKEVLLREIHHRVKNNMQIVSSLLRLQSAYIKDKDDLSLFKDTQDRIRSMALVHEKLYLSENLANINLKNYINTLVESLFKSYSLNPNINVKTDVDDIPIRLDPAIHCGLVINELVSNSLKYAFPPEYIQSMPEGKKAEIRVSLRKVKDSEPKTPPNSEWFELIVSDNGVGIPDNINFRDTKSLGLQLTTDLVEHQLNGKIELYRDGGTEYRIIFEKP